MYLGDYISIERQIAEFTFECECVSSGTSFTAEVDEDKRAIFEDFSFPKANPSACRFLRPDGDLLRCTIHRDSPAQCKYYRCVVMRVSDQSGQILGTVRGTLNLHSEDPDLREIWDNEISGKRPMDDAEAEPWIAGFLKNKGYRIS
jgi:Fe-S-cluster containining protein